MKLDDFEAVFRSSVKERFHLKEPRLESVLLLTDLSPDAAAELAETVKRFLAGSLPSRDLAWRVVHEGEYERVSEVVAMIESDRPDLVVSYRHLLGRDKQLRHSLGSFIDTVTQATAPPVLLVPPLAHPEFATRMAGIDTVLVVTDHIVGDDVLVNWGLFMAPKHGTVALAHVEDEMAYRHYSELIAMIPDVDTEITVARLKKKLLGRPRDYIGSIAEALTAAGIDETIVPIVTMGHALSDYKRIIDTHDVDLMVLNTKDDSQLAMHGMAYAISVEIQDRPLLLL